MFVRYYTTLSVPAERVEAVVLDDPARWMAQDMVEARRSADELSGSAGRDGERSSIPRFTDPVVGRPNRVGLTTIVPISWRAFGPDGPYVALDADLDVAPLGTGSALLGISARFVPHEDPSAAMVEARMLHRSVEFMIKAFLDRAAARIGVFTMV